MDALDKIKEAVDVFQDEISKQRKELEVKIAAIKYQPKFWIGDTVWIIEKIKIYNLERKPEDFIKQEFIKHIKIQNEERGNSKTPIKFKYSTNYFIFARDSEEYFEDEMYISREEALKVCKPLFNQVVKYYKEKVQRDKKYKKEQLKRQLKELDNG